MVYDRPAAGVSGTLYSLHVPTKTWNVVHMQEQVKYRVVESTCLLPQLCVDPLSKFCCGFVLIILEYICT